MRECITGRNWWNLEFGMDLVSSISKTQKKAFLPLPTLTPNTNRFLCWGYFFRWKSGTSAGDNLEIIDKFQKLLKNSTCIRKVENFTFNSCCIVALTNSCCIVSQTFINSYLTYQSSSLKTSIIKKKWKSFKIYKFLPISWIHAALRIPGISRRLLFLLIWKKKI